jgi:sigma-E factor negative regulatory protein RseA
MTYANVSNSSDWQQQMSALMDGTLDVQQTQALLQACEQDDSLVQTWASYHAVGDTLRTHWVGRSSALNTSHEASIELAPVAAHVAAESASAANDSVFRWRMVAGIAAIAAVGSIVWSLFGAQPGAAGAQLAQQSSPAGPATVVASSIEPPVQPQVMLRDPRLDELLAAHKQFGGASALQQPAGFLRNATFVPSSR